MKGHGKEMVVTTALAATLVVTLVLTSNFIASYLETPVKVYGVDIAIEDVELLPKNFFDDIIAAGGGYATIIYRPYLKLVFENGSDTGFSVRTEGTFETSEIREIQVCDATLATGRDYSDEFMNFTRAGNFSCHGNYNKGSEMSSILHVNDETTDLGTLLETNVLFTWNLNAETIGNLNEANFTYESSPIRRESGFWTSKYYDWRINSSQLLEMVDQSESASILFHGSVWVDGNFTVIVNGVPEYRTTNLSKDVHFGRIDLTFKDGRISTLSFKFNRIDIILFVYPEE